MQMEMFMMDNGLMTKLMVMECIVIQMELNMKVIGKKINNMDKDLKHGLMEPNIMVIMFKEKNMEQVNSHGLTEALIMVNSLKTTFKEKVNIIGLMVDNMMDLG